MRIRAGAVVVVGLALAALVVSGCGSGSDAGEARGLGDEPTGVKVCFVNQTGGPLTIAPIDDEPVELRQELAWCSRPHMWPLVADVVQSETQIGWRLGLDAMAGPAQPVQVSALNLDTDEEVNREVSPGRSIRMGDFPSFYVQNAADALWLRFGG